MPKCTICGVGSGETIGQCHPCWMRAEVTRKTKALLEMQEILERKIIDFWERDMTK